MTGLERRDEMIEQIRRSAVPLSGKSLAETYGVSRQVIVQDIALIRAAGYHVISTNRGYVLEQPVHATRVFKVNHTAAVSYTHLVIRHIRQIPYILR